MDSNASVQKTRPQVTLSVNPLVKSNTKQNWETENPVLKKGERGFETDTRMSKTGDGVNKYNDLLYDASPMPTTLNASTLGGHDVDYFATSEAQGTLESNLSTLSTNLQTLSGNLTSLSSNLETVSGSVTGISTDITNDINPAISALQSSLQSVVTDIGTINSSISTISQNVTTISEGLLYHRKRGDLHTAEYIVYKTLSASAWSGDPLSQTLPVTEHFGVNETMEGTVYASPASETDYEAWTNNGIRLATIPSTNNLLFKAKSAPTSDVSIIIILKYYYPTTDSSYDPVEPPTTSA